METTNSIRLVSRVISILKSFSPNEPELGVTEIASRTGIHKATTHRILISLAQGGLLERNSRTSKYRIGPATYIMGSLYLSTTDIQTAAETVIQELNELTGEAVSMSILDRGNVILMITKESKYAFRLHVHIGSILPAHASAMGKVLLSELAEAEIDRLFPEEILRPITKKTVATKTDLKLMLEQIRKTGISFDREGSYEGSEGIASAIRDASGKAVAAVAITCRYLGSTRLRVSG